MASPDVDISTLSDSQQVALQTYTSVTDQDLAAAIPLLQRSQWNVQVYIPTVTLCYVPQADTKEVSSLPLQDSSMVKPQILWKKPGPD